MFRLLCFLLSLLLGATFSTTAIASDWPTFGILECSPLHLRTQVPLGGFQDADNALNPYVVCPLHKSQHEPNTDYAARVILGPVCMSQPDLSVTEIAGDILVGTREDNRKPIRWERWFGFSDSTIRARCTAAREVGRFRLPTVASDAIYIKAWFTKCVARHLSREESEQQLPPAATCEPHGMVQVAPMRSTP